MSGYLLFGYAVGLGLLGLFAAGLWRASRKAKGDLRQDDRDGDSL